MVCKTLKWSIFSLISHPDLSIPLSLLLMFLPHWPVFSNLPTSRSSCLEVSVLMVLSAWYAYPWFPFKSISLYSVFLLKIFCWRFLHLNYPLKNLENITLHYSLPSEHWSDCSYITFNLFHICCLSPLKFGGFPGGSDNKESTCSAGDLGLIPGLGRSPGEGHGSPLQYTCQEISHGQRSLVVYSPWGHKESDTLST